MGQYNNTARVLAGGTAHADTAVHDPGDLTVPLAHPALFIIIFYLTKRRLIRQSTDGSRTEGLSFSKDNLRVPMRISLVITGEVQVDIRLFVCLLYTSVTASAVGIERS